MNESVRIVVLIEYYLLNESLVNKINSSKKYKVEATFESGVQCLNYLLNHETDMFIVDLMLTNIDAIGIINHLRKNNSKAFKKLICVSDFNSLVFEMLDNLQMDYCLRKPFNVDYFMEIIDRISENNSHDDKNRMETVIKNEIYNLFIEMRVPRHLKGYNYVVTGIYNVCNNINLLNEVTKELYPGIAREYATTSSRVEQAIRHVIKVTWLNGNQEVLQKLFGYRAKYKPCNSEFISKIVDTVLSKYKY